MKCEHVEERLSFYAANEIARAERSKIDAHLSSCTGCSESLAAYVRLESSLGERSERVPDAGAVAARVLHRVGYRTGYDYLRAMLGWPALVSSAFVTAGVLILFGFNPFQGMFERVATDSGAGSLPVVEWLHRWAALVPNDAMVVTLIYSSIAALVLIAGSLIVLRYVRN